jgi:hypothetical protein
MEKILEAPKKGSSSEGEKLVKHPASKSINSEANEPMVTSVSIAPEVVAAEKLKKNATIAPKPSPQPLAPKPTLPKITKTQPI